MVSSKVVQNLDGLLLGGTGLYRWSSPVFPTF